MWRFISLVASVLAVLRWGIEQKLNAVQAAAHLSLDQFSGLFSAHSSTVFGLSDQLMAAWIQQPGLRALGCPLKRVATDVEVAITPG